jgi:hypothetical protein
MGRPKKFEAWLRRHLYNERDNQRCSRFVLHHMGAAGKLGSEVFTISSDIPEERIEATAEEIFEAGEADASGIGNGLQTYVVLAFYGDNKRHNGRFTFRARGDEDDWDGGETTEPPTTQGAMAQAMRHTEVIMRSSSAGMGAAFNGLQHMVTRQSEIINQMMEERFKTAELLEALSSKTHERELELLREARKDDTQRQLLENFKPMIPVVMNKLAGKQMLPAADPQSMMLKELFKTMEPEQLAAIQGVLTPQQAMIVLSIAQNYVGPDEPTEGGNGSS